MKYALLVRNWLAGLIFLGCPALWGQEISVAFYYGAAWRPELAAFDVVVLEPRQGHDPQRLRTPAMEPFAYLSVGELLDSHPAAATAPPDCKAERNPHWGGRVWDHTQAPCQRYWIEQIFLPLWRDGWRGFFLDTLDSHRIVPQWDSKLHEAALVGLIRTLKHLAPEARLMLNRGFELLPEVADHVDIVAAESLLHRFDAATGRYGPVPPEDRQWLLGQLRRVQEHHRKPVVVIDYVAPTERSLARKVAADIQQFGFIPYVSDGHLMGIGIGPIESMPRTLLVILDRQRHPDLQTAPMVRWLDMPAQHLGYRTEYVALEGPYPQEPLASHVAGILVWGENAPSAAAPLAAFLRRARAEGIPVLVLNQWVLDPRILDPALRTARIPAQAALQHHRLGFEARPPTRLLTSTMGLVGVGLRPWAWTDTAALVGTAPWGGFALQPALLDFVPGSTQVRWLLNPFELLREALQLPEMPVPDLTTENGRRLLTIHIDGDGFVSRAEWPERPLAGAVLQRFLERHPLPHSISVIEAELSAQGPYPDSAAEAQRVARQIFQLPWVEAASHTFSHPFRWQSQEQAFRETTDVGELDYRLPIQGYQFDLRREVDGSIDFIRGLVPSGKDVGLFFWSGDCNPSTAQLAHVERAGLLNINGGDTTKSRSCPSLTCVAPHGILKDRWLQVYAPMGNENLYTNLWTGPFWGYRRVIETFEMTEQPHRLKPVGIYYHTYSASKPASLQALHDVYAWASDQPLHPIFLSSYIRKVQDFFHHYAVARLADGRWLLKGRGQIRTVRMPPHTRVDWARSQGLAGYADHPSATYFHLASVPAVLAEQRPSLSTLDTTKADPPFLIAANAAISLNEAAAQGRWRWALRGHVPVQADWHVPQNCRLIPTSPDVQVTAQGSMVRTSSPHANITVDIHCSGP